MADPASQDAAASLQVVLEPGPFEPLARLADWAAAAAPATAQFIGRVRSCNTGGEPLVALELEHYPGMTESQLERLAAGAAARHRVQAVLVHHRVGRVEPGEAIVLVAVAADRRGPAQLCCQELLEALKHEAPFWKKEVGASGEGRWVEGNTPLREPAAPGTEKATQALRTG
ncbi:MAG: molybdenum cofactor biosynthesis protein MoaE [Prochlorococcaceae cyanobacterium]